MFNVTSVYSYTGNSTATLNSLTNVHNAVAVDPASVNSRLSPMNYVSPAVANKDAPNPANQAVFMAMPMSWWVTSLTSGAVKYLPVSNNVNWGYTDASGTVYHIGRPISDLLLPNRTQSTSHDSSGNMVMVFEPKLGLGRTDTRPALGSGPGASGAAAPALTR
jgi:hypothetical protein